MNNPTLRSTLITFASFIFVITAVSAWTGPSVPAPDGNVSAPLTISATSQSKTGGLDVGWLSAIGAVKVGYTGTACAPELAGSLRWNTGVMEYCNGTVWGALGGGWGGLFSVSDLRTVTAPMLGSGSWKASTAMCNSDEVIVSGGGACGNGLIGYSVPALESNGWNAGCYSEATPAGNTTALCLKSPTNTNGTGEGGGIGYGQTWQDMLGSSVGCADVRASGVLCTNSTPKPIMVNITTHSSNVTVYCYIGTGTNLMVGGAQRYQNGWGDSMGSLSFIVPPGETYHCDTPSAWVQAWVELR